MEAKVGALLKDHHSHPGSLDPDSRFADQAAGSSLNDPGVASSYLAHVDG
jgi:hypothetical protein